MELEKQSKPIVLFEIFILVVHIMLFGYWLDEVRIWNSRVTVWVLQN